MDLNSLHFDHQITLVGADTAARIPSPIGVRQVRLGAAAACAWMASARKVAA